MLAALKDLPTLFAQAGLGKDKIFACVRMHQDAKSLEVWCADSQDVTYRNQFDEDALTKIKNAVSPKLTWDKFFAGIEEGFNQRKIQVSPDASLMALTVECLLQTDTSPMKAQFILQKKVGEAGGSLAMLHALQQYYWIREDEGYRIDLIAHLEKEATEAERARDVAVRELGEMKAVLANADQTAAAARSRLQALEKEIAALEQSKQSSGGKGGKASASIEERIGLPLVDEPPKGSVARIPLTDNRGNVKVTADYDAELMQLVKSKFAGVSEGQDVSDARWCNVIRPLPQDQLQSQMRLLSDPGKVLVVEALNKIDEWDFNVFEVQNFSDGHSLFVVCYALLLRYGLFQRFDLDEQRVINWLSQVEAGYQPNPYHNSTHAADVLHITHYIITEGGLSKAARLTKEDELAGLMAAAIHDYDHPGINNSFHVKTQSYLARLYSDRSILENHHASEVFELMKDSRFDMLHTMSVEQRKDIRDTVMDMVLATDMGLHTKILAAFKRRLQEEKEQSEKTQSQHMFAAKPDQRLAMSMAIKMADVSNCGRPEHLYLTWGNKIADEFFLQGDRERNVGIQVSPFMDRYSPSMARGQMAFMNYIVIPLFESIAEYLPNMHFSVEMVEANRSYWANYDDSSI
eukprot:TRINITY_DN1842_c0_g1_i1.p1 TRINITY_DN1842_c0_g1~~TRINITY_DN1842_c0_g1_i1.p1  ORF type:complete len:633 (-),score=203.36 TRINITY_DN1842_c0_g1_i1:395-2293(-)